MRSTHFIAYTVITFIASAEIANAQVLKGWEAGLNLSVYTYQGDLTPGWAGSTATPGLGFSLFANKKYSNSLSFRTSFSYGRLRANDAVYAKPEWRQQRNFNFRSPAIEISEMAVYKPFAGLPVTPYLMGGVGVSFLNVQRSAANFNAEYFAGEPWVSKGLTTDLATTPPRKLIVFPVGMGLRVPITSKWSAQVEGLYRFTTTDYLDGFSKSAGADKKDRYTSYSVGVVYSFGNNGDIKCPPVSKWWKK